MKKEWAVLITTNLIIRAREEEEAERLAKVLVLGDSFIEAIMEIPTCSESPTSDCNGEYELEKKEVSDDSPPHNSGGTE